MDIRKAVYLSFLSCAWGFCASPGWKVTKNKLKCFKLSNISLDFVSAQNMCSTEGGSIASLNKTDDVTEVMDMFDISDSPMRLWVSQRTDNIYNERSCRNFTTNGKQLDEIKDIDKDLCLIVEISGSQNITWYCERCDFKSIFLCEIQKKIFSPIDFKIITKGGKFEVVMETRDYVAIAIGSAMLTIFCVVVLVDIVIHVRKPKQVSVLPDKQVTVLPK